MTTPVYRVIVEGRAIHWMAGRVVAAPAEDRSVTNDAEIRWVRPEAEDRSTTAAVENH